jgi:hypothetical protein
MNRKKLTTKLFILFIIIIIPETINLSSKKLDQRIPKEMKVIPDPIDDR